MCSSPKSSGSAAAKIRVKGFYEDMSAEERKRFAEVANRADENRAHRNQVSKRWKAKHSSYAKPAGLINWFSRLIGSH